MNEEKRARYVKPNEALAMAPGRLHQDRKGFFWMLGSGVMPNERRGDVAIVHVRGELEHHADDWGCAESYEGIRKKFAEAYSGQDAVDAHTRAHQYDEDFKPIDATPPKTIVMVIDSPGGVVSGLNETVKALQKLRAEHPNVRTVAYCNEMAASAAYALACSCERIIAPPSAIVGSIGVISTMVSQARRDKKEGFDVRLLTSGARKADGHPHAPLSDKAVEIEQTRVEKLADAFFRLASKARGISVDTVRGLQAGIFLGKDAKKVGLINEVESLDDVIAKANASETSAASTSAGGNQTDRRLKMNLAALIRDTEASIKKEKDPEKLSALYATLAGYKKVEKHVEHTKSEEEDDEEEEEEESAEESEEASAKSDDDGDDDDDEDDGEDEKKSSKATLALVQKITGMTGKKALGALQALAAQHAAMAKDIEQIKAKARSDEKAAIIAGARGKHLTAKEAAWLSKESLSVVKGFVEMREASGVIVHTDESTTVKPKAGKPGTEDALSPEARRMIDATCAAYPGADKKEFRATLVAAHIAEQQKTNGAATY
jgi:signal peptide peptidase SppA